MVKMVLVTRLVVAGEVRTIHVLGWHLLVKWVETGRERTWQISYNNFSLLIVFINRHSRCAADVRDAYKDYFSNQLGEVSWQYDYVRRT